MMKTTVKINSIFKNDNHQMLLLENTQYYSIELDCEKKYVLELKEIKSKRSIQQNKYMWAIIHEIARVQQDDEMNIYCNALQEANAKCTWLKGFPETKEELLKVYRAVKITRYEDDEKGRKMAIFKCYPGSSKFTVEEMTNLIEIVLKWANELGINTDLITY